MKDKFRLNVPRFHVLSDEKCERVHLSTLEVLRRTGVAVKEAAALNIFRKGGCIVDGERVRIPEYIVERALRNTPSRVTLCNRNGHPAMYLEADNVYFGTGSDTPFIMDYKTRERRKTILPDIENTARLVDCLDEISFCMCMGIAGDVDPTISDLYHFEAMVNNTEKPIVYTAWNLENLKDIIRMAEIVAGGEESLRNSPFLALYTEPISPLVLAEESTQKLMFLAEKSLPVIFTPAVMTGGSGPVTLAGGLIQANAEILAGYVLADFINAGTPFIYGGGITQMDMASSQALYTGPELMLAQTALTDMAKHYRLPMFTIAGCSDSNIYDQQASLEGAMWILLSSINGGNLVHDVGYIDNGLTACYEQLVVSDEVIGMVRHIMQGFEINKETMALDLIDKIGPGGEYLTSAHTLRHFKKNWSPDLISRVPYEKWAAKGKKDLATRANERLRYILEMHKPEPLDDKLRTALREIVKSREV
ncbi:MAG: trimethylamine methyltransferase family protein [Candidatus Aminicenantes bacterium]|nr:trimethylamine methyltransferase family protein [Candidatus Aminicenantes bacterium]